VALSGVDLVDAKMAGKSLVLTGYRVALVAKSDPKDGLERRTIRSTKLGGKVFAEPLDKMKITIQPDTAGSFDQALQAVFAEGLGELKGSVPEAWRCYAHSYFVQEVSEDAFKTVQKCTLESAGRTSAVKRFGGGVKPPQMLHQVEPKFTVTAREMKVNASVLVNLIVGRDGVPSNVEIVRAAGAGLDEAALDAVGQYRFSPALENGVGVPATLNIEVNFQVF
jgi:TonB family protein